MNQERVWNAAAEHLGGQTVIELCAVPEVVEVRLAEAIYLETDIAGKTLPQPVVIIPIARVDGDMPVAIAMRGQKFAHAIPFCGRVPLLERRKTKKAGY